MKNLTLSLIGSVLLAGASNAMAGDAGEGRKLARKCQTCHGLDGIAKMPDAPHIAGESQIYLESQLKAFRSGKRQHEIMSVIAKDLSDAEIGDLAAWYASIEITAKMPE